jgi:alcohol dehydrogenase class IV
MASIALPRRMLVGAGTSTKVGSLLTSFGLSRPLIVADPFYQPKSSGVNGGEVFKKITTGLNNYDAFFDIIPDPTTDSVDRCLRKINTGNFDSIVAIGGGSAMVRLRINVGSETNLK